MCFPLHRGRLPSLSWLNPCTALESVRWCSLLMPIPTNDSLLTESQAISTCR